MDRYDESPAGVEDQPLPPRDELRRRELLVRLEARGLVLAELTELLDLEDQRRPIE